MHNHLKNDKYSEDDHRGASLLRGLTAEQIRNKANDNTSESDHIKEDDLIKEIRDLKTTETDMMWGHFANKDKLVSESQVKPFIKPERRDSSSDSPRKYSEKKDDSDDLKDLINKNNAGRDDKYPKPDASAYGPSYGPDKSKSYDSDTYGYNSRKSSEKDESEEDGMLKKLNMLRKLGELKQNGVNLSQNYSMNSDYKAMEYEYELHRGIRDKHNGIRWLNNMMLNSCWGLELANDKFNPFDFNLQGWSEQLSEDTENGDYYDVFGELYEKYVKSGKPIPPEIKLMLMITGSAIKFSFTRGMLNSTPDVAETLDKNPDLRERLRQNAQLDKGGQTTMRNNGLNEALMKQQELARKNAEDLEMLRQQKREVMMMQQTMSRDTDGEMQNYIMQNDIIRKNQQMEIDQLQRQLSQMRSDSRSMYSQRTAGTAGTDNQKTMKPPVLPNRFRNRQGQGQGQGQVQTQGPGSTVNQQMPFNYNLNNNNQEIFRQRQIMDQKKMMKEQADFRTKMMQNQKVNLGIKIDESSEDASVNYNSNFNEIIGNAVKETGSNGSGTSITMSDTSKGSRRGRKKKQTIKIKT